MLNNINLCGRVTAPIELKKTNSGKSVAQFSLAVERDFTKDGEKETDFINIVVWGNTADFVSKYFTKGRMMLVNGRLRVRKFQTQNGENRYITEVLANNVYFAGDKAQDNASNNTSVNAPAESYTEIDDDLPF